MTLDTQWLENLARRYEHTLTTVGSDPTHLLFGEAHGNVKGIVAQFEFIHKYQPEFVLHELFDTRVHKPGTVGSSFRRDASRNREQDKYVTPPIAAYIEFAKKYGYTLVGCDLTHQEKEHLLNEKLGRSLAYKLFGSMRVKMVLDELGVPYDNSSVIQDAIDPERHKEMASTFLQHTQLTNRPLLAIIGNHHATANDLQDGLNGLSYCVMSVR